MVLTLITNKGRLSKKNLSLLYFFNYTIFVLTFLIIYIENGKIPGQDGPGTDKTPGGKGGGFMTKKLAIRMLGEFSLASGSQVISDTENRSKKVWTLLAYMICFRNREISQQELIDMLWANDSSENPANALKTMFHRVRMALNRLDEGYGQQLIRCRQGVYSWNNSLEITLDIEAFEDLAREAKTPGLSDQEKLAIYRRAVAIYQGDFLPKYRGESWIIPISVYYHMLFMQIIHDMAGLLSEQGQYAEIAAICGRAVEIDPYDEDLYYHLIKALVDSGQHQAALREYERMTGLFYQEFGVTPGSRLNGLYREVVKTINSQETDLHAIRSTLKETDRVEGAFFCEYEFFKDIYRVEARSALRSGSVVHIGLITVSKAKGGQLPLASLNQTMAKLKECIRLCLRKGDIYARYSVSQYIVMLTNAAYENSLAVLDRIVKRYNRENPRSTARLDTALLPLDPVMP